MDIRGFLVELRGRRVYRVAALYAAGSWALLQVADLLFPVFGFPDWAVTAVLVSVALGFPIALVLSWIYDITPEGVVETSSTDPDLHRYRLTVGRLVEAILILALVLLVGYLYVERLQPDLADGDFGRPERQSIAVLAFENMSDDPSIEYFGDGVAEEILNLLTRVSELDVAARTSSFFFKDRDADIGQIAERLGVSHVLEGSVRRQGDQIRVTAQLIDASNGFHLWSNTFDRDFRDSFGIQDEVAREVVSALGLILSADSQQVFGRHADLNPDAYDYYLRGRDFMRRSQTPENLRRAAELFRRAVALDDGYAEALAGLCDAHLGLYRLGSALDDFQQAEAACQQALALDSDVVPVHVALGNLYRFTGDHERAMAEFERSLEVNDRSVDALDGLAQTYLSANQPDLAERTFLRAIQVQPRYPRGYLSMGSFLFRVGRFEEAIPFYRRLTELMPEDPQAFNNLGAAYFMTNQFEPANEALQTSLAISPSAFGYSNAGASLFFLGRFDEAADLYRKALEMAPEDPRIWSSLGDAYRFSRSNSHLAEASYRRAIELATEHLKVNAESAEMLALLAHAWAAVGDRERALNRLAAAIALAPANVYVHYSNATTHCLLGEPERARTALQQAVELGFSRELAAVDASLCNQGENIP